MKHNHIISSSFLFVLLLFSCTVNPVSKGIETKDEIEDAYEKNTGVLITDYFKDKDHIAVQAVLCKNHGPFGWGKDPVDAVHTAVVLEEVAKMATRTEAINKDVQECPQEVQDKHYYRKHGANAYYGQ